MSDISKLSEALTKYSFDPKDETHRKMFDSVVALADVETKQKPIMAKAKHSYDLRMAWIVVAGIIVTISFMIWVNHLNHQSNIELDKVKVERQK